MLYNIKTEKRHRLRIKPLQTIVLGFALVILIGTLALMLPVSTAEKGGAPFLTAAFTAISATCVTGLTVVDTLTYWSRFGHCVILGLIQFGGLGAMSMIVLLALMIRKRISPRDNLIVSQSLGLDGSESTATSLMKIIVTGTFSCEFIGAMILSIRFIPEFGVGEGLFKSFFHSISAFCNAGFDVMGSYKDGASMTAFSDSPLVLLTLSALIITGGIGFIVWADVWGCIFAKRHIRLNASEAIHNIAGRKDTLFPYTKFVLIVTSILIVSGTVFTAIFEWDGVLAGMSVPQKLLNSFFHSVTLRTAGFAAVDNGSFAPITKSFSVVYMFIGGSSGSTAGGVKVSTVALAVYAMFRVMGGNTDVVIFGRKVKHETVLRALALVFIGQAVIITGTTIIMSSDGIPFIDVLYEVTSAYATVGLSAGITSALGTLARVVIMIYMFFGRVGLLTILLSVIQRSSVRVKNLDRPDTQFLIG